MKKTVKSTFTGEHLDDLNAIESIKKGNKEAFAIIFVRYKRILFNQIWFKVRNKQLAEDLTMEIMEKVFCNITEYKKDKTFNSWLTKVANNYVVDYFRKTKVERLSQKVYLDGNHGVPAGSNVDNIVIPELEDSNITFPMEASHETIYQQRIKSIKDGISLMKPKERKVMEMFFLEGRKHAEISKKLKIGIPNIKLTIFRGKEKLRQMMIRLNPDLEAEINYNFLESV